MIRFIAGFVSALIFVSVLVTYEVAKEMSEAENELLPNVEPDPEDWGGWAENDIPRVSWSVDKQPLGEVPYETWGA